MSDKQIILCPNATPQFTGQWSVGEVRQMAQGLMMWLDSVPLNIGMPIESDITPPKQDAKISKKTGAQDK